MSELLASLGYLRHFIDLENLNNGYLFSILKGLERGTTYALTLPDYYAPEAPPYNKDWERRDQVCSDLKCNDYRVGGKYASPENSGRSAHAECWVCRVFNTKFWDVLDHPDPGWDFLWCGHKVDVKWTPWLNGKLLVPERNADKSHIYIGVFGEYEKGWHIGGWAWGSTFTFDTSMPTPAWTVPQRRLLDLNSLLLMETPLLPTTWDKAPERLIDFLLDADFDLDTGEEPVPITRMSKGRRTPQHALRIRDGVAFYYRAVLPIEQVKS